MLILLLMLLKSARFSDAKWVAHVASIVFRGIGFPVVKWVAHFASDASQGCKIFRRKMSCSCCFYCFSGVYDLFYFSRVQDIQMQNELLMLLLLLCRGVGFPVVKWVAYFASDAAQGCRIFRSKMSARIWETTYIGLAVF